MTKGRPILLHLSDEDHAALLDMRRDIYVEEDDVSLSEFVSAIIVDVINEERARKGTRR